VHLEGPFLSPHRAGAHRVEVLQAPDLAFLTALPARVRLVTLAPELPGALDAVAALRARGVTVALGHSDAGYDEAVAAADAGARLVTHVFNAMAPLHHRAPGRPEPPSPTTGWCRVSSATASTSTPPCCRSCCAPARRRSSAMQCQPRVCGWKEELRACPTARWPAA